MPHKKFRNRTKLGDTDNSVDGAAQMILCL